MEYLLYYIFVGLLFWAIMFSIELFNFIKKDRKYSSWSWAAVIHGFLIFIFFWPWAFPFYIYERIS